MSDSLRENDAQQGMYNWHEDVGFHSETAARVLSVSVQVWHRWGKSWRGNHGDVRQPAPPKFNIDIYLPTNINKCWVLENVSLFNYGYFWVCMLNFRGGLNCYLSVSIIESCDLYNQDAFMPKLSRSRYTLWLQTKNQCQKTVWRSSSSNTIHVWYIYLHFWRSTNFEPYPISSM